MEKETESYQVNIARLPKKKLPLRRSRAVFPLQRGGNTGDTRPEPPGSGLQIRVFPSSGMEVFIFR